jgi:nucleolar MIF4G domain-containing protein 1
VLYAAFVSCLHKLIGIEFGIVLFLPGYTIPTDYRTIASYFVQNVITTYEQHYKSLDKARPMDKETRGKECSNLIVLISELYNFQVISSILVFDIIRVLLHEAIAEFNVELLLKIVRSKNM